METLPLDLKIEISKLTHRHKFALVKDELLNVTRIIKKQTSKYHYHNNQNCSYHRLGSHYYTRIMIMVQEGKLMWIICRLLKQFDRCMYLHCSFERIIIGHTIHQLKYMMNQIMYKINDWNMDPDGIKAMICVIKSVTLCKINEGW
jgi:hypothetical protein